MQYFTVFMCAKFILENADFNKLNAFNIYRIPQILLQIYKIKLIFVIYQAN